MPAFYELIFFWDSVAFLTTIILVPPPHAMRFLTQWNVVDMQTSIYDLQLQLQSVCTSGV